MKPVSSLERVPQVVVSVSGDPKTGKTHFAVNSPGPVFHHEFDMGSLNRVLPHIPKGTDLQTEQYFLSDPTSPTIDESKKTWAKFVKEYKASVIEAAKAGGTVVIDPETILWEVLRNAMVDPSSKKGAMAYGDANAMYKAMIGFAKLPEHRCNLVLIHYTKPVWEQNDSGQWQETNKTTTHSHKSVHALADIGVRLLPPLKPLADPTGFRMKIEYCGMDPKLTGKVYPNPDMPLDASMSTIRTLLGV